VVALACRVLAEGADQHRDRDQHDRDREHANEGAADREHERDEQWWLVLGAKSGR